MARLAVLASGNGTNFQSICESLADSPHRVVGLICDREGAGVLDRAANLGIPSELIRYQNRTENGISRVEARMIELLESWQVDLIALAGYMRILSPRIVRRFGGRIVNIHPSLLPRYPGLNAIERSHGSDDEVLGISIHFVDDGVDTGPIIRQETIPRVDGETLEGLEQRIHTLEHLAYPQVIRELLDNGLRIET